MSEILKIVSSQYKLIPARDTELEGLPRLEQGSMLRNEPFSFQAFFCDKDCVGRAVSLSVDTELPVECFRIDYVGVIETRAYMETGCYESDLPGLYPDILTPRPPKPEIDKKDTAWNRPMYYEKDTDATINLAATPRGVWVTLNPDSKSVRAGEYEIRVTLTSLDDLSVIASESLKIKVIDRMLPKQTAYYTNWFYVDCICDLFGVKLYSNAFYRIFSAYLKNMTRHRQNTLLLPAFTPPLDTAIGAERMNVQLVEVERDGKGWRFGFDKMRRFVRCARKNGIEIFEHCHLFSQWGARATPNIYNSEGVRIFGADTDAVGKEYTEFIREYLAAFFEFAKAEGIDKSLIFHVSDEPCLKMLDNYRAARDTVADLLEGNPICDAMSDLEFYTRGLVDQPILSVNHVEGLTPEKCPTVWLYYTGGEKKTTNRKITNTAAATRAIGIHMYKYSAVGFLHWAYNYCYDRLSIGFGDPAADVNVYKLIPGICNLCYPIKGRGKTQICPSVREKLMCEGFDDLRALRLLESMIGREETLAICEARLGEIDAYTLPSGDALRLLREEINERIAKEIE